MLLMKLDINSILSFSRLSVEGTVKMGTRQSQVGGGVYTTTVAEITPRIKFVLQSLCSLSYLQIDIEEDALGYF